MTVDVARDPLAVVHEALLAAGAAASLAEQVAVLARAASAIVGGAATAIVRDATMESHHWVRIDAHGDPAAGRDAVPVRAPVWRRWMRLLERRATTLSAPGAASVLYALDLHEAWIRREFGTALCGLAADGMPRHANDPATPDGTLPDGVLLALPRRGGAAAVALAAEVRGGWPPATPVTQAIELLGQQLAQHVAAARLAAVAERRAERLQRLQDAGAALARSLDEQEITRELARQLGRLVPADGVVIAQPDVERGVVRTPVRVVRGLTRPRADQPLGDGVIAEVARTGRLVRVDDYVPDASPLAAADDVVGDGGPAGSVLAAPMRVGTQLMGVVAVHASAPRAFHADDEELLRAVAAQAATAIANARLFAESEAERRQSEAFAEVARAVGGSLRFGDVMRLALRHTAALLRAEGACVALQRDDYLHIVAGVGSATLLAGVHVPVGASMMGRAVRDARAFVSNDVEHDGDYHRPLQRITRLRKAVLVPLVAAGAPIGVVAAINREADFTAADAHVLQRLADHVAVAIVNARLFEEAATATREWKVAFDAIAAGMVVVDDAARVLRANARAAELTLHAHADALLGRALGDVLGVEGGVDALLARTFGDGDTVRATLASSGGARRFDVVAAPHPDGGAVVTFDDVTAQHERAAALERSEARYERLVEAATDVIFTIDAAGRLTAVNHALEQATGRARDALLGADAAALLGAGEDSAVVALLRDALHGRRVRGEVLFHDREAGERVGSVVAAPIVERGTVVGALAIIRDVTDERRLAEQLIQREKLASVGRLVRGVAHELNNPLASISTLAELLATDGEIETALETADTIHREAMRAARIVERLHAYARQRAPERAPTDVNRTLLDALDLRRHALRMQEVDLVLDLDYEIAPTWADAHQLQQVFLEIVGACEQAFDRDVGTRALTLRTRRDGDTLSLAVAARGASAPAPVAELDAVPSMLAAEVVREHGGRLRVDASDDGVAYVVELPYVHPPAIGATSADDRVGG